MFNRPTTACSVLKSGPRKPASKFTGFLLLHEYIGLVQFTTPCSKLMLWSKEASNYDHISLTSDPGPWRGSILAALYVTRSILYGLHTAEEQSWLANHSLRLLRGRLFPLLPRDTHCTLHLLVPLVCKHARIAFSPSEQNCLWNHGGAGTLFR